MNGQRFGKITNVYLGIGGYQDYEFGVYFDLGGDGWGCSSWMGTWSPGLRKHKPGDQWDESNRDETFSKLCRHIDELLNQAKVTKLDQLIGKPIIATFDGNLLKRWRLLTEVI